jgi:hypothetical protein
MNSQKRILKVFIIIILAVFLLSTGLVSVMYLVDSKPAGSLTGENLSGTVSTTGVLAS